MGLVTELPFVSGVNFSAFRAFRALRALRTMKYAQGLRQIVDTFVETFRGVINVLFVYSYFVFLFATLGIDLFQGTIISQCVVADTSTHPHLTLMDAPFGDGNYTIATPVIYCVVNSTGNGVSSASSTSSVLHEQRGLSFNTANCPIDQVCQHVTNPGKGFLSWDQFGVAMLSVMRFAGRAPGTSHNLRIQIII